METLSCHGDSAFQTQRRDASKRQDFFGYAMLRLPAYVHIKLLLIRLLGIFSDPLVIKKLKFIVRDFTNFVRCSIRM